MSTGRVLGRRPNQRLRPALPETTNWWSEFETVPIVAIHVVRINRVSPDGNLIVANLPSRAISWAKAPALRAMVAPCPGRSSIQEIIVPKGMFSKGMAFPISGWALASDISIVIKSKEACPLDLAPTSSTTSALAFGDALAIALLESKGFTSNDFASSHPAGKLGKKLITQVKHLMHQGSEIPSVGLNTILSDALIEISEKNLGITLVKKHSKVEGIFTDGDLRRCLNQKIDINTTKIKDVMTKKFKTIEEDALAVDAATIMEKNKIFTLVVMKKNKNVGVIAMHDLIQARIL